MVTKTRTRYSIICDKVDEIVAEYMKQFEIVNYFNPRRYEFNWGKYIKQSRMYEMFHNKKYERWGDLEIVLNDTEKKITCYSGDRIFTDICEGLEKLLLDEINIAFDVLIVKEYCDNKQAE